MLLVLLRSATAYYCISALMMMKHEVGIATKISNKNDGRHAVAQKYA
jgi:hypothetical protein